MKKKKSFKSIFFKNNFKFYEERNYKNNAFLIDRERLDATVTNSLIALAISRKYKSNIIILSDKSADHLITKFYRKLGFNNYIFGINKFKYFSNLHISIITFFICIKSILKTNLFGFSWFIKNFKVKNILIGDLIYDTYIKFSYKYTNPQIDFNFLKFLFVGVFRTLLINKYLLDKNISRILSGTQNYSFNSGIALRIGVYKKIKNFYLHGTSTFKIELKNHTLDEIYHGSYNVSYGNCAKNFKKFNPSQKQINNFLNQRKKLSGINYYTGRDFYMANSKTKKFEFLRKLKKTNKKIILFACHALSDAAHGGGINYCFDNYFQQLDQTLKIVNKYNKDNIWLIRPHPSSKNSEEEKIIKKLLRNYSTNKNILFCSSEISIKDLYSLCDTVVTGKGTVGLEFICEGKNCILAGESPYSKKLNLKINNKSKQSYFNQIKNINNLKKINNKTILLAKKILFFYESGNHLSNPLNHKNIENNIYFKKFVKFYAGDMDEEEFFRVCNGMLNSSIVETNFYKSFEDIV